MAHLGRSATDGQSWIWTEGASARLTTIRRSHLLPSQQATLHLPVPPPLPKAPFVISSSMGGGDLTKNMKASFTVKVGLAQMLKGGIIMDVTNVEEARIAEEAGAVAVMALERVPADIRKNGGVARMSDPTMINSIKAAVTIPVMAKARIGHYVEAQILEALGVDYIDESEVPPLPLKPSFAGPCGAFSRLAGAVMLHDNFIDNWVLLVAL